MIDENKVGTRSGDTCMYYSVTCVSSLLGANATLGGRARGHGGLGGDLSSRMKTGCGATVVETHFDPAL